jgi:LEA14-like dessication related protein
MDAVATKALARCAAAFLLAAFATGCESFPGWSRVLVPEVSVMNVVPLQLEGFESSTRVDLRISNPNEFPLEINGLRFALEINDRRFARGQTDEVVEVPRLGDARVSLVVRSGLGDMIRQITGMKDSLSYRISGDLFLKNPYDRKLAFGYESEELRWDGVSGSVTPR